MSIIITQNNIPLVKQASKQAIQRSLEAIGVQASNYAADKSPVDTGRLKNSMTYKVGNGYVDIGTDVEYGKYQEFGTSKFAGHHMIRDAVTQHTDEYKRIVESYLKGF